MTTSEKRHTMRAVIDRPTDYPHVAVVIGCPWEPDDPDRDCRMSEEDGTPLDGCALRDWLDAAGHEGIGFDGPIGQTVALPVQGRCERRGHEDWPTFVVDEGDEDDE